MVKNICNRIGISYFLLSGVMLGAVQLLALLLHLIAPELMENVNTAIILSSVSIYAVAMPICWKLLQGVESKELFQDKLNVKQWLSFLSIAVFIVYVGGIVGSVVSNIIGAVTPFDTTYDLSEILFKENLALTLIFAVIIGPILEELFFRKLLIDRVIVFGDKAAIILSGLMFGMFHGNFQQFFFAGALGCLLAYIYIRTGKLIYSVSIHMAINFLNGFVEVLIMKNMSLKGMYFDDFLFGNTVTFLAENAGMLGWIALFGLVMIVLFISGLVNFIILMRHHELKPGEYSMPFGQVLRNGARTIGFWLFLIITIVTFILNMLP